MNFKLKITIVAAASLLGLSVISNVHADSIRDGFIRPHQIMNSFQKTKAERDLTVKSNITVESLCANEPTECLQTCCEEYEPGSRQDIYDFQQCQNNCMIEDLSKDPHETVETPNASDRLPTKEIRDSLQRARQLLRVTKDHIRVLSCQQHCSEQCVDDPAEEEECMDACDEMSADEHPLDPARDFCLHGRNIRVS